MDSVPPTIDIITHLGRVWRRGAEIRDSIVVRDCPPGWIRHAPGQAPGEVPSSAATRVLWTDPSVPLTRCDVMAARDALRALGVRRAFAWLSPLAWNDGVDVLLAEAGATRWPHVEYPILVRAASPLRTERGRDFTIRRIVATEAAGVLERLAAQYPPDSVAAAVQAIERGFAEFYGAFVGDLPVALSALIPDGAYAYLGWMGTLSEFRGRGAQAALIAARVGRAAELGARWCVSETNTVAATSLRNLRRHGFGVAMNWHVYSWESGSP